MAATCPRILYFDHDHTRRNGLKNKSITRIWKEGSAETTACGSLFHNAIERFNRFASEVPEVREPIEHRRGREAIEQGFLRYFNLNCVDRHALAAKPVASVQAFVKVVQTYMGELVDIVVDALARGKPPGEILDQLFGDRRRRVNATFQVGPQGEPVRVVGVLDYVFYDWRAENHRIIDYKLTPAHEPSGDLFQIGLYALMHHIQHRTQADVGVLYLHPDRRMFTLSWEQVEASRSRIYDLLASMAGWIAFDESQGLGLKPPGEPAACTYCRWDKNNQCVQRLGPKHEGDRLRHWSDSNQLSSAIKTPRIEVSENGDADAPTPGRALGTATSEDSGTDLLRIGTLVEGGQAVGLPIEALPTHIAVVGAAGSGKTWMAKVLAEEAIRSGVPVLAIDPQGDLVQFLRPSENLEGLSDEEQALRLAFLDRVEPRIWTPGSSHARRLGLNPLRLASPSDLEGLPADRREEEWRGMLVESASQLVALARAGGEQEAQRAFLFQLLLGLSQENRRSELSLEQLALAVSDPESVGLEDPDRFIRKAERQRLARMLNALLYGPSANLYEGGESLDLELLRMPEEPGKVPLNVVYLNALIGDDQKQFVVAMLAAEVYRWMVTSLEESDRPNLLFYLDEARDFIPAGTSKPPAKEALIRLFAQGRKYGVSCLLCTQSPRSVDYNVFGNCSTKLIGRLESAQDLSRVADWFGSEGRPTWLDARKGADAGSFVGRWPDMPAELEGQAFQSRHLFSRHEGAWSPDRLERELAEEASSEAGSR